MERGVVSKRFDPDLVIRAYMDMNINIKYYLDININIEKIQTYTIETLVSVLGLYLFLFLACTCSFVLLLRVFASSESRSPPPSHRYSSETKPIHAQDLQLLRYGSWVWIIGMDHVL